MNAVKYNSLFRGSNTQITPGPQKHALCTKRCQNCIHGSPMPSPNVVPEWGCMYIVDIGKRRGCPAGDKCTKFKKGRRRGI